jgi:hypothetical protein
VKIGSGKKTGEGAAILYELLPMIEKCVVVSQRRFVFGRLQ